MFKKKFKLAITYHKSAGLSGFLLEITLLDRQQITKKIPFQSKNEMINIVFL